MDKCAECGRALTKDEIGLHKKLFNRYASRFMCIDCCASYLDVPRRMLELKIRQFKDMGCTLFE